MRGNAGSFAADRLLAAHSALGYRTSGS